MEQMLEHPIVNDSHIPKDTISHDLEWTEEKINAFWDYISSSSNYDHSYFTHHVGKGIINLAQQFTTLQGKVLDFDCRIGYLTKNLIKHALECYCCDLPLQSIKKVQHHLKNNTSLKKSLAISNKSKLPFEKNGHLIITTPYNEPRPKNSSSLYYPDYRALFHRYQLLRSFNQKSLSNFMLQADFNTLCCCNNTDFNKFQRPFISNIINWSPLRRWKSVSGRILSTYKDKIPWQKNLSQY